MKSPLLQKRGLDAFLQQLNDPETAIHDPRADKEFEHPYGSKGTEPETVKQGASDANSLASEIDQFLQQHAKMDASEPEEYSSPDAGLLKAAADSLRNSGTISSIPFSDWGSGGYKPYLDKKARAWHDSLLAKLKLFIGSSKVGFTGLWRDLTHPEAELPPTMQTQSPKGGCPTCGGGLTRQRDLDGKIKEVCTKCTYKPKSSAAKPKCPHCGSYDYSLMPTDFETAKCDDCGKNWDHGIIEGINDPKTAAGWGKAILPAVALMGIGSPSATPMTTQPRPAIVEQFKPPMPPSDPHMDRLVKAIARAEGAKPERNNPGNIVDFTTGKIKTFKTYRDGDTALRDQLKRIADGQNPNFNPKMTLRDAGLVYSNGDPNWAKNVASIMRVSQDIPIGHLIKGKGVKHGSSKQAAGINVAVILNPKKFAAKNAPDPGQYNEEAEEHTRQEAKQWAQYAEEEDNTEDIKPFDPEGNYLCGDCDMRQGTNECMRVNGPINFEKGSCRLFHEGSPENKLPMVKKFTKAEAMYAESDQGGFGCHRCEYGGKAKEADSVGRESWCSFWGMHIEPMSCCAENELEKKSELVQIARAPMHDDSGATTGLRNRPDYGESDSYVTKMNEANKSAGTKIKWHVDSEPTGRYRSFERRGWPSADYANGDVAARIECPDEYHPRDVREGKHAPLTVFVSAWRPEGSEERKQKGAFGWRKLTQQFATLKEAQAATAKIIDEHPELHPEKAAKPVTGSLLLKKKADWTMTCPWCHGTAHKANPVDDFKCLECKWTSAEGAEPKAMAQHAAVKDPCPKCKGKGQLPFGKGTCSACGGTGSSSTRFRGYGAVEIHETPKMLPPRDDMRRHMDKEVQDEVMEGVFDEKQAAGKKASCVHCGQEIGEVLDPWGGGDGWTHHPDDGPDSYRMCHCNCPACQAFKKGGQAAYEAADQSQCIDGEEAEPIDTAMMDTASVKKAEAGQPGDVERGLEFQRFLEPPDPNDMKNEARDAFMQDPDMQEDAASWGMSMDEFWEKHGQEYANEYLQSRQASKTAVKAEEGIKACPKCTSVNVEEVTDSETKGGADQLRLYECGACSHLFSL